MKKYPFLLCLLLLWTISGHNCYAGNDNYLYVIPETNACKPHVSIVGRSGSDALNLILAQYGTTSYVPSFPGAQNPDLAGTYELHATDDIAALETALKNTGNFRLVERVPYYTPATCSTPAPQVNDGNNNYALDMIEARCAWSITTGSSAVIVGVTDSEFDLYHPDLNNGKMVSVWQSGTLDPVACQHGTLTAGTVAARTGNGTGVASIGRDIRLAGYQPANIHLDLNGNCTGNVWPAIWQAYLDGRKVINISWNGTGHTSGPVFVSILAAIKEMTEQGTTLVLAAGNDNAALYHSAYANIPGVINVGGIGPNNQSGEVGNFARNQYVDLCAPAKDIPCIVPGGGTALIGGTSISAPFVSGTIGLMLSVNPCLTPLEIETILKQTCDPVADAANYPGQLGAGRLNAYKAVQAALTYRNRVYANTTWTDTKVLGSDVWVEPGVTLTITGTVLMGCNKSIIVRKGGKLIVDGGHISRRDGYPEWGGIQCRVQRPLHPNRPTRAAWS